ncbi:hypothetical protein [Aquibacillus salsiterrae]|uniref:Uncharacterized protein n=1 Tax=Aquibacillus salsiterrae TaxID=2950439 RepID=A0A9X4AE30_9BACI|nr:hypothetical protein [Aquibacillus salsiterrae]MDC3416216.1 hypothetical protein [Aquibacillus salsiterrae]
MNINTTIDIIKKNLENNNYIEKKPNPLFLNREEPPFFTFSPYLVAEEEFIERSTDSFFVNQECYRYCDPDMISTSPLSVPLQNLIGYYKTTPVNIKDVLHSIKGLFEQVGLNSDSVYVVVNEDHTDLVSLTKKQFPNVIPFVREDMLAKNIPLTNDAYYMRFIYLYNGGVIGLCNIVLLDRENDSAKIDGIVFTERIHFIINNVNSVYETELYFNSMKMLKKYNLESNNNSYVLISNMKAAITLYRDGCSINGKKAGHNLKRLIKDAANACILTGISLSEDVLSEILDAIKKDVQNSQDSNIDEVKNIFIEHIGKSDELTKSFIEKYKEEEINKINEKIEEWKSTYGLSERILSEYFPKYVRNKMTVGAGGQLQNGFWGYIFGNNTIEDPYAFYGKKADEVRSKR